MDCAKAMPVWFWVLIAITASFQVIAEPWRVRSQEWGIQRALAYNYDGSASRTASPMTIISACSAGRPRSEAGRRQLAGLASGAATPVQLFGR
jgi:hypothetical protein